MSLFNQAISAVTSLHLLLKNVCGTFVGSYLIFLVHGDHCVHACNSKIPLRVSSTNH